MYISKYKNINSSRESPERAGRPRLVRELQIYIVEELLRQPPIKARKVNRIKAVKCCKSPGTRKRLVLQKKAMSGSSALCSDSDLALSISPECNKVC